MSDPRLDPDHERLLREVAVGDRPADDPAVRDAAARSPLFRDELGEVRAMTARLDAAARFEAETLERASNSGEVPATAAVRRVLSEAAGLAERRPTARRKLVPAALGALAAAALVVIWIATRGDDGPEQYFGSSVRLERPVGVSDDYSEFRWADPAGLRLKAGEHYTVEVFSEGDRTAPIAASGPLDEPVWKPERTEWPERIVWVVIKHSPAESPSASRSDPASASRR